MAITQISDVWVPEVYTSYSQINSLESTAFLQSGIVVQNGLFNELANGPGKTVEMPFWKDLDNSQEPNYSNDNPADIAEPDKIETGDMMARVSYLNNGWSSADLVTELNGRDPMRQIATRVNFYWQIQLKRRILAIAIGLYQYAKANGGMGLIIDNSTADAAGVTSANRWSLETYIDAIMTRGDAAANPGLIAVHSVIYSRMLKADIVDVREPSTGQLLFQTYKGVPIVIDDGMPTFGSGAGRQYLSIIFAPGAIGMGRGTPKKPVALDRVEAAANGGGIETLWERKTWMLHPFGFTWKNVQITGPGISPTWADLMLADNWGQVVDRKALPFTFIVTNG